MKKMNKKSYIIPDVCVYDMCVRTELMLNVSIHNEEEEGEGSNKVKAFVEFDDEYTNAEIAPSIWNEEW